MLHIYLRHSKVPYISGDDLSELSGTPGNFRQQQQPGLDLLNILADFLNP